MQLVFLLLDLAGMDIELLRKLGGVFTADSCKGRLRSESPTVIPARSSGHGSPPALGKTADLKAEISPDLAVEISRAAPGSQNRNAARTRAQYSLSLATRQSG
jgi:hypothetical protein